MKRMKFCLFFLAIGLFLTQTASAQTSEISPSGGGPNNTFTYQGSLKNNGVPANGNFDFEFALFTAQTGGTQIGSTLLQSNTPVTNGIFTAALNLEFSLPFFNHPYLEIRVRPVGGGSYTVLNPRQQLLTTPYSIKSYDASFLGGIPAQSYITNQNGAANFISNTTQQQPASNFNISGNGVIGGGLGVIGNSEFANNLGVNGNILTGGSLGIGVTPSFKLDVAGRSRFRQNSGDTGTTNSAGIWLFQNTPNADRAFIGMENDNSVGFFGVNGGGWGLVMNTQTGRTSVVQLGAAGSLGLCRNASNEISTCSSSLRYKTNINPFGSGLDLISRLRPVTFNWLKNDQFDFGLVAEEVAAIEPLLVTYNDKGEVEGVKYDRLGVVLINAVGEQQKQIEAQNETIKRQQTEIDSMKTFLCSQYPTAEFCQPK